MKYVLHLLEEMAANFAREGIECPVGMAFRKKTYLRLWSERPYWVSLEEPIPKQFNLHLHDLKCVISCADE